MTTEGIKDNIDYEFIDTWLEYGQRLRIAREFGLHPTTGYKILKRNGYHKKFLEACYQAAFENANKWIAMKEQAKLLTQKIAAL